MTTQEAQKILDKIVAQIFNYQNPVGLVDFMQKFAFDVRLPQQVTDAVDGKPTWAQSTNPTKFVRMENARNLAVGGASPDTDFLRPKRAIAGMDDILNAWGEINLTTTERQIDSLNVLESDNVYHSENVYRSQDIRKSKNILCSDGLNNCEYIAAGQRSGDSAFCIRIEDSGECTNCFGVSWSGKLANCLFMHDASDMQDSMFCTNIKGKRYCVANMQYTEEEYRKIREIVLHWVLTS